MGKALVIKGADFSQVRIRNIELNSKKYLTLDNALLQKEGYLSWGTKEWTPSSDGTKSNFWPVSENEYIVIDGNITAQEGGRLYFCTIVDGTPIYNSYIGNRVVVDNKIVAKSPINGYVVSVVQDGSSVIDLPQDSFITNDESAILDKLTISKLNPVFTYPGWCKADGSWGSGSITGFWPVIKGETIKISTGQSETIISLKTSGIRNIGGQADYRDIAVEDTILLDDNIRIEIGPNSVEEIEMPDNGYLSILMIDADNDVMPTVEIEL